jgi:hypothetical protein
MNWNKAKNISIYILLILNGVLFLLVYLQNDTYRLNSQQQQTIIGILSDNNISVNTPLVTRFSPMRPILLYNAEYDIPMFELLFGVDDIEATNNTVIYTNDIQPSHSENISREAIRLLADGFVRAIPPSLDGFAPEFRFERLIMLDENLFNVSYRQVYGSQILFNNFVSLTYRSDTLLNARIRFSKISGYSGTRHEIYPCDEVLFVFMREMRRIDPSEIYSINQIDIVYYTNEINQLPYINFEVYPAYRIHIDGIIAPYIIDAYTRTPFGFKEN